MYIRYIYVNTVMLIQYKIHSSANATALNIREMLAVVQYLTSVCIGLTKIVLLLRDVYGCLALFK